MVDTDEISLHVRLLFLPSVRADRAQIDTAFENRGISFASLARQSPECVLAWSTELLIVSGFPLSRLDGRQGAAAERPRDSRECPGPTTEAELSRPSTHRVLTAGAVVLAAIAPAVEPAERTVNAGSPPPSATPAVARKIGFGPIVGFSDRPIAGQRASRSAVRRGAGLRPATPPVRRAVRHVAPVRRTAERSAHRSASRLVVSRRAVTKRPAATYRAPAASPRMAAVVAFALSQVGKDYVRGGEGRGGHAWIPWPYRVSRPAGRCWRV